MDSYTVGRDLRSSNVNVRKGYTFWSHRPFQLRLTVHSV